MTALFQILTSVAALIGFVGLVIYSKRYLSAQSVKSQLEEKDDIINTNRESIEALRERVRVLEEELNRIATSAAKARVATDELRVQLNLCLQRYQELEKYTAPKLTEILISKLEKQNDLFIRVEIALGELLKEKK